MAVFGGSAFFIGMKWRAVMARSEAAKKAGSKDINYSVATGRSGISPYPIPLFHFHFNPTRSFAYNGAEELLMSWLHKVAEFNARITYDLPETYGTNCEML
jgi:hypothetical protein